MSCERNQPCRPDPIEDEARAIGRLLDNRQGEQAANYLREDSYNMPPAVFNRLVNRVMANDRQGTGNDLYSDRGDLVIDMRNQRGDQIVVATRDYDANHGRVAHHRRVDDRWKQPYEQPRYDQRQVMGPNGRRDVVSDTVIQGVVGAAAGAAIDGRRGAVAGGAGAVAGKMVDQIGGPNNRDAVTDTVVKGVVGAAIGGAVDGNKGAKAGAAGAILGNIIDRMQNK